LFKKVSDINFVFLIAVWHSVKTLSGCQYNPKTARKKNIVIILEPLRVNYMYIQSAVSIHANDLSLKCSVAAAKINQM